MKAASAGFNKMVENIYNLPLSEKEELLHLLEYNIADSRRDEIVKNYKAAQKEPKEGKLKFSSSVSDPEKML